MTSDDKIVNQRATLKGSCSAGRSQAGAQRANATTTVEWLAKSPTA